MKRLFKAFATWAAVSVAVWAMAGVVPRGPKTPRSATGGGGGNTLTTNTLQSDLPTPTATGPTSAEEIEARGWDYATKPKFTVYDNFDHNVLAGDYDPSHGWPLSHYVYEINTIQLTKEIQQITFPTEYFDEEDGKTHPLTTFGVSTAFPNIISQTAELATKLNTVVFPEAYNNISPSAIEYFLEHCSSPHTVIICATTPPNYFRFADWAGKEWYYLDASAEWLQSTTLRVPYASLGQYRGHELWSQFGTVTSIEPVVDISKIHTLTTDGFDEDELSAAGLTADEIAYYQAHSDNIILTNSQPDSQTAYFNITGDGDETKTTKITLDGVNVNHVVNPVLSLANANVEMTTNGYSLFQFKSEEGKPHCGIKLANSTLVMTEQSHGSLRIFRLQSASEYFAPGVITDANSTLKVYGGFLDIEGDNQPAIAVNQGVAGGTLVIGNPDSSSKPVVYLNADTDIDYVAIAFPDNSQTAATIVHNSGKLYVSELPLNTNYLNGDRKLIPFTVPGFFPSQDLSGQYTGAMFHEMIISSASANSASYFAWADENHCLTWWFDEEELKGKEDDRAKLIYVAEKLYTLTGRCIIQVLDKAGDRSQGYADYGLITDRLFYMDIEAEPEKNYEFAGWTDGNTEQYRSVFANPETPVSPGLYTFIATFSRDYNTYWTAELVDQDDPSKGCRLTGFDFNTWKKDIEVDDKTLDDYPDLTFPSTMTINRNQVPVTQIGATADGKDFEGVTYANTDYENIPLPSSIESISQDVILGFASTGSAVMTCDRDTPPAVTKKEGEEYRYEGLENVTLRVPIENLEAYRSHEYWSHCGLIVGYGDLPTTFTATIEDKNLKVGETHQHSYLLSEEAAAAGFHPGPELPVAPEAVNALAEDASASQLMGTHSWESSDTDVAEVDANGLVTAKKEGDANIKVKITSPYYEQPIVATSAIHVDVATGVAELTVAADENVTVYDLNGVTLHTGAFGDMPRLAPGVYILKKSNGDTHKFIIR